jgi:hypothetical protein
MIWAVVAAVVVGGWLLLLGLCRTAAPQHEVERRLDDEAQRQALREWRERNCLTAKIPGGEARR